MRKLVLEIAGLLAALFVKDSWATDINYVCNTPHAAEGDCINIKDCPELVRLLLNVNRTAMETTFLQQSECGMRDGTNVFACCRYQINNLLPDTQHCGQSIENRIYGGSVTHIDEYPWVALIEYVYPGNKKKLDCGGSLINNRYVLTAAHCIPGDKESYITISGVRLGEWNITTDPDCQVLRNGVKTCADPYLFVASEQIHVHPDYSPNIEKQGPFHYNDIALIRLNRNINFTDFIQPICLPVRPYQRSKIFDGVAMQVTGWGYTETGTRSTAKKKVTVSGYEFESCRKKYLSKRTQVEHQQMCAGGEPGRDACGYDSGGPLMTKQSVDSRDVFVLVGIVSFGSKHCGTSDLPGVYTRVGPYMEWIESVLQP